MISSAPDCPFVGQLTGSCSGRRLLVYRGGEVPPTVGATIGLTVGSLQRSYGHVYLTAPKPIDEVLSSIAALVPNRARRSRRPYSGCAA
jgi:hypothetical protein